MENLNEQLVYSLFDRLSEIEDDDEFLTGVLVNLGTDENIKEMIKFLNENPNVDYEQVVICSLLIGRDYEGD